MLYAVICDIFSFNIKLLRASILSHCEYPQHTFIHFDCCKIFCKCFLHLTEQSPSSFLPASSPYLSFTFSSLLCLSCQSCLISCVQNVLIAATYYMFPSASTAGTFNYISQTDFLLIFLLRAQLSIRTLGQILSIPRNRI